MGTGLETLLLFTLASNFQLTRQLSSWWISDTELFIDYAKNASIYVTTTHNSSEVTITEALQNNNHLRSFSRDMKYTAEIIESPEAHRYPDRNNFTLIIHDNSANDNYTIGNEILTFKWSHGSAFSFSDENGTYYVSSPGESPIKIHDKKKNNDTETINGTPNNTPRTGIIDWSLQVKGGTEWFSPSDRFVAYSLTSSNSTLKAMMTVYDRAHTYDYNYEIPFVKTGEIHDTVTSFHIWSVKHNRSIPLDSQLTITASYYLFASPAWVVLHGKELLLLTYANRWQNETILSLCSYETARCSKIFEHKYEPRQWASGRDYENIVFSNSSLFVVLPMAKKENAWQSIAKIEITPDFQFETMSYIPTGEYDIRNILTYRSDEDIIIYDAQAPHPWNRHIYAAPAGEKRTLHEDVCLTCGFSNCTFQDRALVSPAKNLSVYVWCNGPSPPHQIRMSFDETLKQKETRATSDLEEFIRLSAKQKSWITETFLLSSGYEAVVRIYEGNPNLTSMPVTLAVYGGPDFNQVSDEFGETPNLGNDEATVYIDVRGSGGRGWKYRSAIYGRLVTVEVDDTIEAMKMVLDKYPRFDKNRVGLRGWSYGGTMTLALVEKSPPAFFKCAIAGAPVTNFLLYSTWYPDRYMGDAPTSSFVDLTLNVTAFNSTKLLLIHGLRDDNVLFQHSALLIESLQQADIPFELMVYPNQDHGVRGKSAKHLKHLCKAFLSECYAQNEDIIYRKSPTVSPTYMTTFMNEN